MGVVLSEFANRQPITSVNQLSQDPLPDLLHRAGGLDAAQQAQAPVMVDQRSGLLLIHVEAVADHRFVVVGPAAGEQALDQHTVLELQQHHQFDPLVELRPAERRGPRPGPGCGESHPAASPPGGPPVGCARSPAPGHR